MTPLLEEALVRCALGGIRENTLAFPAKCLHVIVTQPDSPIPRIIRSAKISVPAVVKSIVDLLPQATEELPISVGLLAYSEARSLGNTHVGVEHALLALSRLRGTPTGNTLDAFGLTPWVISQHIIMENTVFNLMRYTDEYLRIAGTAQRLIGHTGSDGFDAVHYLAAIVFEKGTVARSTIDRLQIGISSLCTRMGTSFQQLLHFLEGDDDAVYQINRSERSGEALVHSLTNLIARQKYRRVVSSGDLLVWISGTPSTAAQALSEEGYAATRAEKVLDEIDVYAYASMTGEEFYQSLGL